MKKEIFEKELAMCQKLSKNNNGKCNWGECEKCGVIPLLHKLFIGKIYEKRDKIEELKRTVLQ